MNKRKLALMATGATLATNAFAVLPGFYMGLMLGPATNNGSNVQAQVLSTPPSTTEVTPQSQQFGSRIYMGYKSSQYFGAEGGFTYYSGIKYDAGDANTCSTPLVRVRDLDVMGRGSIPFGPGFEGFAKAGAAVVYMTTSGCLNTDLSQQCGRTSYSNQVKPVASAGLSYDMTQNWVIDASWTRLFTGGVIGSMDMYALGLSYHFVDTYCGQFLCA